MKPAIAPLKRADLEQLLERVRTALGETDYQTLKAVVETLAYLTQVAEAKQTTIQHLRRLLFGGSTEKTRNVLMVLTQLAEAAPDPTAAADPASRREGALEPAPGEPRPAPRPDPAEPAAPPNAKGHGRNGAEAYRGAEKIRVRHDAIKAGAACPGCLKGKVYGTAHPGVLVRIVGQAPLQAKVYELEKLRCNLCGELFTADPPAGVGAEKYDATAGSMIGLLKYGSGLPFYRQEQLQESLEIPLPASTQWGIVRDVARVLEPAYAELIREAAQGDVLHNDDTGMTILAMGKRPTREAVTADPAERTGVFTSGIVSTRAGQRIALFFTGRQHAGENLAMVLAQRAAALGPPIQMCDALSRNLPGELAVIVANCVAHARRKFIEVAPNFPAECRHVLETLGAVYQHDALARERGLSPDERVRFHAAHSGPLMDGLKEWLSRQLEERTVEPNSGLGQAIAYMLKHWTTLTLFLREPGAPLDNNLCERALKKAILHRKNALFFKTAHGAHVGDVFMSLIHTCQLAGANPFDYLTELQRHAAELAATPQAWMPWNYRQTLERASAPRPASD
jgi:transposase